MEEGKEYKYAPMKEEKEYKYAGRKYLSRGMRGEKMIDMEYVYRQIDLNRRTVKEIAEELGVSVRTLQRHHKKYQEEALRMEGLKKKEKGASLFTGMEKEESGGMFDGMMERGWGDD